MPAHSPKVSRTQQRPNTHRTLMVSGRRVASPLQSQEPPPPPHPESSGPHTSNRAVDPPTKPRAGRAAFSPRCLRAGDGKHEHTNRASPRTLGTQWGRAGGDPSPPIGTVQVRCPMPEAWLLPIGLDQQLSSNRMAPRAPHTPGHPLAWEALASEENRPMNAAQSMSVLS